MSTKGRAYVWIVIVTGCVAVAQSLFELLQSPPDNQWWILALMTLISGSATVKLPAISAHISVSETFLFSAVLIFGPSAGVATVILDSLIITVLKLWKKQRSPEQVLFNLSAPALSMWVGAHLYYLTSGSAPLASLPPNTRVQISSVIAPLLLFAVVCFALNSGLVACAVAFQQRASALAIWRKHFLWLSLNYFGGASVAALLVVYTRTFDWTFFGVTVPLILVLYMTFRTSMARVADATRHLEELNSLYLATVQTLAAAIDAKDQVTHGHIRRVQRYAVDLAKTLGVRDEMQLRAIQAAAVLHDTGKIAVPEAILNKPGPLDAQEFAVMKQHAAVGADIISSINFPYLSNR